MTDAQPLRVLIVEDDPTDARLLVRALQQAGHAVDAHRVDTPADLRRALAEREWDAILSDWSMPQFTAIDALAIQREIAGDVPFIIVSGTVGEEVAVEAMRAGAHDFVLKDRLARLAPAVERELRERQMRAAKEHTEAALRRSEEQLQQAQKMEAIGVLAGGIAHDFNNLLSVILSYTDLAVHSLPESDPLRADMEEVHNAGCRAAELTRQLLAFSRRQVMQPRVLDLNEVLVGMQKLLGRLLGEDIQLALNPAPGLSRVKVDPGQIEQVVMNLAVNARDAMPRGGMLTIETANVDLDVQAAAAHVGARMGPHVMIAVSDSGCGMDRETRARVFEPFFTTKEVGRGTGLGLSTVLGIVQQSGGTIWVYSELDVGTTFKIYLPAAPEGEKDTGRSAAAVLADVDGSETVLLVEDDPALRTLACTILRRHGYAVLDVQSGGDALLACEQHAGPIHLLLTDVVMPRMSGRELATRLLARHPDLRVLYMSGYTDDAVVRHGILEADVAFLQKPITPAALVRKVREVLDAT